MVTAVQDPVYPATAAEQTCLMWARHAIRGVERFLYRQLGSQTDPQKIKRAENMLRTAIGLRRMLDSWNVEGGTDGRV